MVYRGHVENGMIRLEDAPLLPEGVEAEVRLLTEGEPREKEEKVPSINLDPNAPTIEDKLRAIWADVSEEQWNRLPLDLTDNLDHYIYGTPK